MIQKLVGLDALLSVVERSGGRAKYQPDPPTALQPELEAAYSSYYGDGSLDYVNAARQLTDKTWLVCCTVSSFVDTFASHSNIAVVWCVYTS